MQVRFILQPAVAVVIGIRLGVADARAHAAPFLLRVFRKRSGAMKQALSDILLPFCMAVVVDALLQYNHTSTVRPLSAVLVGLGIVWLPYAIARAITNRIVRSQEHPQEQSTHAA